MSAFDTSDQGEQPTENQNETTDFVAKIKEAKGDKWADPQEIAKGYLNAQKHIDTLEDELRELRENSQKKDWAEEVLSRLEQRQPASRDNAQASNAGASEQETPSSPSADDIKSLIVQTLTEEESKRTKEQNLSHADRQLEQMFGTEAKAKVQQKANELGMPVERMRELAEESPTAFFALLGEAPQKETNSGPRSQLNTSAGFDQSGRKNWAYYQKLRRENPRQYRTPAIQNEMLAERQKQGEDFYT